MLMCAHETELHLFCCVSNAYTITLFANLKLFGALCLVHILLLLQLALLCKSHNLKFNIKINANIGYYVSSPSAFYFPLPQFEFLVYFVQHKCMAIAATGTIVQQLQPKLYIELYISYVGETERHLFQRLCFC